jgi:hypothetical protein
MRRRVTPIVGRTPWVAGDTAVLAVLVVAGSVGLTSSWVGVSAEANWHHQLSWLAGAILSVAVAGVGVGIWLYRGRRRVRAAAAQVWTDLRNRHVDRSDLFERWRVAPASGPTTTPPVVAHLRVSTPTMTRYHHPACPLVQGKSDVSGVNPTDIAHRGLQECGVCAE